MMPTENKFSVKVSVVLPTFNQKIFLANAIKSILDQTYHDFELIVVNDGSTDETAQLLANIQQHPKIRILTQENQGLPNALNNGFAIARGEFWTWTSTDNIVAPTWLEELVKALEASPPEVGYAFSHYAGIDENGNALYINREQRFDIPSLLMRNPGNASFLYRSELARKVGPYDPALKYAEDLDMWVRMAAVTRATLVETVLYYYRHHNNSMTTQQNKVKEATKGVINKYLAKTNGLFNLENIFPHIKLSNDSLLEQWKCRIWLATLGAGATYYCPVIALVDQLVKALKEKYDRGLVGNIVHLLVKENRWDYAAQIVTAYRQLDSSDFLITLADIITQQDKERLNTIPYLTIEEKQLATDCTGSWSQNQLLKNLAFKKIAEKDSEKLPLDETVKLFINCLSDGKDHPEIWQKIASLRSPDEKTLLRHLKSYLTELTQIPQDPNALMLLKILEAVCVAYHDKLETGKRILEGLRAQSPDSQVLLGALFHLKNEESLASLVCSI